MEGAGGVRGVGVGGGEGLAREHSPVPGEVSDVASFEKLGLYSQECEITSKPLEP